MTPVRRCLLYGGALLIGILLATSAGCDGGSKQASQSQRFSGTWNVLCVFFDNVGCQSIEVRFEIEEGDGQLPYRLIRAGETQEVIAEGTIEIGAENRLRMTGNAFSNPLIWRFDFDQPDELSGSVRLTLVPRFEDDPQQILEILGFSGGQGRVEMDLVRPSS